MGRDQVLDGLRAVAACGVVFSHALNYRFVSVDFAGAPMVRRLVEPIAETSVQIFFVISGYIITLLLVKEERADGRFSLSAFYIRRCCRIIPPLAAMIFVLIILDFAGIISLDSKSIIAASTFTCNVGLVQCQWWVAHTWSLAVEEQYYLIWPLLLILISRRVVVSWMVVLALSVGFLVTPIQFHSNYISFICIGVGSICALAPEMKAMIEKTASAVAWFVMAFAMLIVPVLFQQVPYLLLLTPFAIAYLVFTAGRVGVVAKFLTLAPIQLLGLASYSLYLWQQVFLARPSEYLQGPPPIILLPLVVAISVLAIERPFIKLGKALSAGRKPTAAMPAI